MMHCIINCHKIEILASGVLTVRVHLFSQPSLGGSCYLNTEFWKWNSFCIYQISCDFFRFLKCEILYKTEVMMIDQVNRSH